MRGSRMERFWDARARESALFFVDSRLDYREPDAAAFWAGGDAALEQLLTVLEAPPLAPHHVAVDIGCGVGRLTRPLAARTGRVLALDVSGEMLAQARALNPGLANVEWLHGDGRSLAPIADASADVCISHVVFRHIPDPGIVLAYVREIGRVLRPGGFAAFEVCNAPAPRRLPKLIAGRRPRGLRHPAWTGSCVAVDDVRAAAGAGGMRVTRVVGEGTEFCGVLAERTSRG